MRFLRVALAGLSLAGGYDVPRDWPLFGVGPDRTGVSSAPTGITARTAPRLTRRSIRLPGTVDSAPIYLHGVTVAGRKRSVVVMTTSYGRTLALDARTGKRLWQFVPPGIGGWEGTERITTAAPATDGGAVYAASPDGNIHKLALADGREQPGWPVAITRNPTHEKLTSALNVYGGYVLATTSAYIVHGELSQGHVVTIDTASGALHAVFNSQCSNVRTVMDPRACPISDSAIWGRAGAVVDARAGEVYVATGNAPFDGVTSWGDSMLVLSFPDLDLKRNWTPRDEQRREDRDEDVGSVSPVLLPDGLVLQGGKDGGMDLLSRATPNGHDAAAGPRLGGELQRLPLPRHAPFLISGAPSVRGRTVFVATSQGTAAYRLAKRRLHRVWQVRTAGTTPVYAGGLLYEFGGGRLSVVAPRTGRTVASLEAGPGHWSSPIAIAGRVWLPVGDANLHKTSGRVLVYSL